eukprot:COSAG01_NODE_638_length_14605_cov_46.266097_4_plen_83_part_00
MYDGGGCDNVLARASGTFEQVAGSMEERAVHRLLLPGGAWRDPILELRRRPRSGCHYPVGKQEQHADSVPVGVFARVRCSSS